MKLQATEAYEWPPGTIWTVGKVRDIEVPKGAEVPAWLVEVKPKAKANKAKQADEG